MSFWRLVAQSARFYWRTNAAVLLAVVVATGVLTGALAVGDSVRFTLGKTLEARLGEERIGDVANVAFSNGWVARADGTVFIYYASSDTRLHVATSSIERLLDYGESFEYVQALVERERDANHEVYVAGQPVLTVADFSTWLVKTENLTEVDVVNVSLGQKVEIVLDALPTMVLTGTVTDINTRYVEKRGDITYTVTIELDSTDPQLRWGMTAFVNIRPE